MIVNAAHFKGVLLYAKDTLASLIEGERLVKQGLRYGDPINDTEIRADHEIGKRLRRLYGFLPDISRISIEGSAEDLHIQPVGSWIAIDPIDGSLNYARKGRTRGFPYTCCVTVLSQPEDATFSHIVAAGVIDLREGVHDIWMTVRELNEAFITTLNDVPLQPSGETTLDLGSQVVIGELYYPEHRKKLFRMFDGQTGWLRNPGSAAYEMASVASGQAVAYICDRQKQHELGAGYALVKGAGGVAIDWEGRDLGSRTYDFKTPTPVILAANQAIADQLLELIRQRLG